MVYDLYYLINLLKITIQNDMKLLSQITYNQTNDYFARKYLKILK